MKMSGSFFDVYITNRTEGGKSGFRQVSVGVKVSKKAVERNKIKRRVREVLRAADIPADKNIRIVALRGSLSRKFFEIKKDLENIFIRL